jgi:hypothetical protein
MPHVYKMRLIVRDLFLRLISFLALRALLLTGLAAFTQHALAHTETISLHPVADTSLFEMAPDNNLGGASNVVSGTNGQLAKSRTLLRFDIAGNIPAKATITAVTLTMTVSALPGGSVSDETTFNLHRLTRSWGEGSKSGNNGAAAGPGEATWKARLFPDSAWSQPGAAAPEDFVGEPSASMIVTGLGAYNFESNHLIADVQNWLADPSKNFGWILVNGSETTSRSARRFASRESDEPPALLVQYIHESDEFKIDEVQISEKYLLLHLNFPAGKAYSVQFRDSLSAASWQVLTNFPVQEVFQHFVLADPRGPHSQRFYRVEIQSTSEGVSPSNNL